jgi:hypothetical protein
MPAAPRDQSTRERCDQLPQLFMGVRLTLNECALLSALAFFVCVRLGGRCAAERTLRQRSRWQCQRIIDRPVNALSAHSAGHLSGCRRTQGPIVHALPICISLPFNRPAHPAGPDHLDRLEGWSLRPAGRSFDVSMARRWCSYTPRAKCLANRIPCGVA